MFWNIEYEYPYEDRLRDEFAKAALEALIGSSLYGPSYNIKYLAEKAYDYADAMMCVRQERMKNEAGKRS